MSDKRAYDVLVAELPRLREFTHFLTGNVQAAEELFQDSVERAIGSIDQLDRVMSARAWLFTIARNRHIDQVRRRSRKPDSVPLNDAVHSMPTICRPLENTFLLDLSRSFARISIELRETMWLVGVEGFSYAEAADVLNIPVGTIRSRMFRARDALRREMSDYWPGESAEGNDE